jgi:hypothetical protein
VLWNNTVWQQGYLTSADGTVLQLYVTDPAQSIALGELNTGNNVFTPMLTVTSTNVEAAGDIVTSGNVQCVAVIQTSDARLKHDIVDSYMTNDDEARFLAIHPVKYKMHGPDERDRLGVLAQELEQLFPDTVLSRTSASRKDRERLREMGYSGGEADTIHAVDYTALQMRTLMMLQRALLRIQKLCELPHNKEACI